MKLGTGVVAAGMGLALAGGIFWFMSSLNPAPAFAGVQSNAANLLDVRHPVTADMLKDAQAKAGMELPPVELLNSQGQKVNLASLPGKPIVVVMTKDGCPCNIESQPFFNQIAKGFGDKVQFYGIIDGDKDVAEEYRLDFKVPYPILLNLEEKVFRAFGAKQSVYTYLFDKNGKAVKIWPGYSAETMTELNDRLAELTASPAPKLDLTMASPELTSGCYFFRPIGWDPVKEQWQMRETGS